MGGRGLNFTADLWKSIKDIFEDIINHPFIRGLVDGTLSLKIFKYFVVQDSLYLRDFSRALAITAAKSPRDDWLTSFADHAKMIIVAERALHDSFFKDWKLSEIEVYSTPTSPTNLAYTSYLISTAYSRPFHEVLGALLPCYWIYLQVGKKLEEKGSSNPLFQRWIETYASEEFESIVKMVLGAMDELAKGLRNEERNSILKHFRITSIYEYLFWDSAYKMESWPFKIP